MVDHSSASEHNDFTRCLSLFDSAFPQILSLLGMPAPTQLSPDTFYDSLDRAREKLGNWNSVAARFNYNEQEMASFLAALRTLNKWLGRNTHGQPADRNLTIAALRFLWQLEYLREKQPQLTYSTTLHNEGEEKQLRSLQQVRALELTIRSLINEAYNNQQALLEHLNKLFGPERVKKWLNVADRDDVLSGTLFSELASLFIDKDEYPIHYSPLYQYTPLLSFVNDKRRTLNTFLDDIRVIRNRLAHHKRVTSVQTTLVNYYYREITEPVQEAFDEGRVKVNPDRFFDDSNAEVARYFERTSQKIDDLGGDVQGIKDDLVAQAQDIDVIKTGTNIIRKRVAWVLGGIVVLIVGSVLTFGTSTKTLVNTESIRSDLGEVGKTVAGAKKETSNDPRKELANIGIAWDEKNLRAAIDRGDTQVVNLFLAGGMRWKLYYAEAALQEDREETLNALLQSASLMDEKNGCLRMAGKLRQPANHNGTLTPIQIRYLKTFCSSVKDVQGIKAELDRALNFEKAQKKAYDEEMAKNEPAGRCERRLMADNARDLLADAAQFSLLRPTTYSLHDVLLKELNTRLMFGTLNGAELKSLVKNYCVKQENHEPNIAIDDNWSRSQRVIYNVVK